MQDAKQINAVEKETNLNHQSTAELLGAVKKTHTAQNTASDHAQHVHQRRNWRSPREYAGSTVFGCMGGTPDNRRNTGIYFDRHTARARYISGCAP